MKKNTLGSAAKLAGAALAFGLLLFLGRLYFFPTHSDGMPLRRAPATTWKRPRTTNPTRVVESHPPDVAAPEDKTLTVEVRDRETGRGLSGATVYLVPVASRGYDELGPLVPHAATDEEGLARFVDAPADCCVGAKLNGYRTSCTDAPVPVSGHLTVQLEHTQSVEGLAMFTDGGVADRPVIVVSPFVTETEEAFAYPGRGAIVDDSVIKQGATDGHFSIPDLVPGMHKLQVRAKGGVWKTVDVSVPSTGLVVQVDRSAAVTITVKDWRGKEDDILTAYLYKAGTRDVVNSIAMRGPPNGTVTIDSRVPPGNYHLEVTAPGIGSAQSEITVWRHGESISREVVLSPLPTVTVSLADGHDMAGYVILYDSQDRGEVLECRGAEAVFELKPDVLSFEYFDEERITTRIDLQRGASSSIRISPRRATTIRIESPSAGTVSLHCRDVTGKAEIVRVLRPPLMVFIGESPNVRAGDRVIVFPTPELNAVLGPESKARKVQLKEGETNVIDID